MSAYLASARRRRGPIWSLQLPFGTPPFRSVLHLSKLGSPKTLCFLTASFYSDPRNNPNVSLTLRVREWRPDSVLILTRNRKLLLPKDILERRT